MVAYVIMAGEYSSTHVVTVTLNKEKAEKLVKYYSGREDNPWIEPFELDQTPEETLDRLVPVYSVRISKNGSANAAIHSYVNAEAPFEPLFSFTNDRDMVFCASVLAKNEEHAIKIARDKRMKMLAEEFGL